MSDNCLRFDDRACAEVMRRYRLKSRQEAVNFALRALAGPPASVAEARALRGIGWEGDLDAMRSGRSSSVWRAVPSCKSNEPEAG